MYEKCSFSQKKDYLISFKNYYNKNTLFHNIITMEINNGLENNIKIIGLLHFLGNICSWGILWTLLVILYLLLSKEINEKTKKVCYNIINFNLSFWIYFAVSFALMFILIGFLTTPIVFIVWIILLVIGFIKHLAEDDYKFPLSIEFLK